MGFFFLWCVCIASPVVWVLCGWPPRGSERRQTGCQVKGATIYQTIYRVPGNAEGKVFPRQERVERRERGNSIFIPERNRK